jgi:hypothetical protein
MLSVPEPGNSGLEAALRSCTTKSDTDVALDFRERAPLDLDVGEPAPRSRRT